ncbi:MAG: tetratricopeptide repeat protein, partial [Armatimonadota bacterium]|nr:tetratricopeptide repeat protein [Armatimonadota bacterium]
ALCDYRTDKYSEALTTLQQLQRQFPKGALTEQVKQYVGLSHLRAGNEREARKVFKDFLRDYPKSKLRDAVYQDLAETYHVPNPRDSKELELAIQVLRQHVAEFPAAIHAEYNIGLSYFNQQRYEDAVKEFQAFIEKHARANVDEVALAKNNLGFAFLRQKKYDKAIATWEQFLREHPVHRLWNAVQRQVIDAHYEIGEEAYKAKKYDDARRAWQAFQEKYPLDVRNADIMFRLGVMLDEEKKYDEAIEQWRKVASKYPDTEAASRAQFMIAMTYEKLDKFEAAMTALREVGGNWQQEAQRRLQLLKERKLVVYTERTFTSADSPTLKIVTRNIQRLNFRAYKVDISDYFRKLHTMRGVEKLDLGLIEPDQRWNLEIANYREFKEHETAAPLPFKEPGVYAVVCGAEPDEEEAKRLRDAGQEPPALEATNIVLITDLGIITKTTHNDVFVFAENLKTRQPWPKANVLLSDGRKIIATGTTDNDGVFHYRDQGSGIGDQGLRVRVQRTANALTPDPRTLIPDVRVLAFNAGHYASTEGDLRNVARASRLQPTAYLYSDRPLYRPGQPVHLRGIVRDVENGVYVFKIGDEYVLTVTDSNGAVVHTRKVQLGDFGTFNDSLVLGNEAPVGRYTIMLTKPKKGKGVKGREGEEEASQAPLLPGTPSPQPPFSATGTFDVATYQLDKVRLLIELPKTVYLRGEEIKGKVIAKYYYGEALAKRKVRFGWNSEIGEERETNEKGEFEFTIPTRQFDEEETVTLWARLEDEGAQTRLAAYVAVVGVRARLSMLRDLHLVGEKFDVTVETTDLAGKAFSGDFTLKVLKHVKDEVGRLGEREVQTLPVRTDDKGKAKVSLSLNESGEYALRLTGQDANGNPLTSELETRVVGDEDEVRLRVLTDTDSYKLGDTAGVRVIWRGRLKKAEDDYGVRASSPQNAGVSPALSEEPAEQLALVTYEGERIYGYQLVTLKKGDNEVKVPLTLSLSPVFRFSIALMDGPAFHHATKWFRVEHELRVKIKTERGAGTSPNPSLARRGTNGSTPLLNKEGAGEVYRPGDKVRATIETTDQNGKPVSAELSLAVVDESLLAVTDGPPSVLALLQTRNATDSAILTTTSCTFNYADEARKTVVRVKEAAGIQRVMLAGVEEGADLPRDHWAYTALNRLSQAGVIEGLPDGTYAGKKPMTRYEAAVAVARLLEKQNVTDQPVELTGPQGPQGLPAIGQNVVQANQPELLFKKDIANNITRDQSNELAKALRREFAGELSRLGVRVDELDLRSGSMESRINKPPKITTSVGVLHRAGTSSDTTIAQHTSTAGGLLYDNDFGSLVVNDPQLELPYFNRALGIGRNIVRDPQNALLVQAGGERQLRELVADRNLSEKDFQQLVNALRNRFAETAFWSAAIVTDKDGKATTEFTLPDSLTEWRLTSRGVTTDTLVGEGSDKITSSKPFLVELKTPAVLQQGDHVSLTAVVHNNSDQAVKANVMLHPQFDGQARRNQPEAVSLEPNSVHEVTFALDVPEARSATFKLEATTDQAGLADSIEQSVPVRPWGIEHVASAGGEAQGDRVVEIKLPEAKYLSQRLAITVGPSVATSLIDIAANPGGYGWSQPLVDSTVQRALSIIQALGYMRSLNRSDEPLYRRLSGELEGHLNRLVQTQNKDGGWSWALPLPTSRRNKQDEQQKERESDVPMTADVVSALAQAKELGLAVPNKTLTAALSFLQTRFQAAGEGQSAVKALTLYAQSVAGAAEFAHANRLYRLRNALDARSLALLVLTLANMNRDSMALEVARLLEERIPQDELKRSLQIGAAASARLVEKPSKPTTQLRLHSLEDVAIVTLALATAEPKNALLDDLAQFLWARRTGNAWQTPRSTAWTLAALIQQARTQRIAPEKYTLAISVHDKEIKRLSIDGNASTTTVDVPAEMLGGTSAKVAFDMEGKGTFTYSCVLTGFTTQGLIEEEPEVDDPGPDKTRARPPATGPLIIERTYTQAPRIWDGKPVPRGFSAIANGDTWENRAHEVPIGKHVEVQVNWWTPGDTDIGENMGNYIVVREPLPAGCRVLEESISGDFERYELGDGEITFFF